MNRRRRINSGYLFVAPSMLVIAVFVIGPILQALWMSVHDWSFVAPETPFVGLANYRELAGDDRFWNALTVTAVYTLGSVPVQILLALAVALALNERLRALTWFRAAFFFPVISSLAVMAIVWRFLLDPDIGLLSHWLSQLGVGPTDWLQSTTWALPAVIGVGIWKNLGFTMVILLAGLQGVPETYYEAAAIDGAGRWARFRHITLPGLRQTMLFVTVIGVIASLQAFDQIYVMTRGGPLFTTETLVSYMYHQAFDLFRMGYAAAIAWVLFVIIMVGSAVQLRLFRYQDVD
ncbi:MAG: sugar ABC transporter permease [Chloroflexota bacterium]|nr:sugar ABC transporter permease [Chloroflexota bacterium]